MRLILFLTGWYIKYLVNHPFYKVQGLRERKMNKFTANENIDIRTFYKLISKDIVPKNSTEILVSFYNVWPWNKLKELVFSVISWQGEVNFFIGNLLQVLLFSFAKSENLERGFSRSFPSKFVPPIVRNYDPVSLEILSRKWDLVEEIYKGL